MSDATVSLDVREQIVRIDRAIAETAKFSAETRKLLREARFIGWQVIAALLATGVAGGALLARVLHLA